MGQKSSYNKTVTKWKRSLLQSASGIAKCVTYYKVWLNVITKSFSHHKVWHTVITKSFSYYKMWK